ncbi:uridine kinase family protein [Sanyastnella coralliicola]|uniref:uridine kinase family protein n=1 Tax=Sanyastnella coralliicola TaxID=3069118 RepID=UPI0027B94077|nr:uridine-cytidine kinase [Longitalea sp. SCSIO 12813]
MKKPYLIGIVGGSASGKTSFLNALLDSFGQEELSLVSQDNYYRPAEEQPKDENGWMNFDLPESIYGDEFVRDLEVLKSGQAIERLEYTFNNPAITPAMIRVEPTPVVISEGLFVLHYAGVREMLDFKVYIDADADIRLQRRIDRDAKERGYPEDEVRYQWANHVRPADQKYLEPYKDQCDLVVNNNESFEQGLAALVSHIKSKLT